MSDSEAESQLNQADPSRQHTPNHPHTPGHEDSSPIGVTPILPSHRDALNQVPIHPRPYPRMRNPSYTVSPDAAPPLDLSERSDTHPLPQRHDEHQVPPTHDIDLSAHAPVQSTPVRSHKRVVLSGPEASDSDGPPDPKRAKTVRFESATQDEEIAEENGTELYLTSGNAHPSVSPDDHPVSFSLSHIPLDPTMTPLSNTSAHTGIDRSDDVPHGSIQLDDPMPLDNPSLGDSTVHDISSPPRDPASEDQPMSQAYPHEHDELMLPYNPPPVDTTIRSIPQPPEFSESHPSHPSAGHPSHSPSRSPIPAPMELDTQAQALPNVMLPFAEQSTPMQMGSAMEIETGQSPSQHVADGAPTSAVRTVPETTGTTHSVPPSNTPYHYALSHLAEASRRLLDTHPETPTGVHQTTDQTVGDERVPHIPLTSVPLVMPTDKGPYVLIPYDVYHSFKQTQTSGNRVPRPPRDTTKHTPNSDGYEPDVEDEDTPTPRQSKPRGFAHSRVHETLREFLREVKLLPSHSTDQPPPESILDPGSLDSYIRNGTPEQDMSHPQLAWDLPWSHQWNDGMLFNLAGRFLEEIRNKSRPLMPPHLQTTQSNVDKLKKFVAELTPISVQKIIRVKLQRARTAYRTKARAPSATEFQAEWSIKTTTQSVKARHSSRRVLLFNRRMDVVSKHDVSEEPWNLIQDALLCLGVQGTSSDESDEENHVKCVRRIRLAFLNPHFATLFSTLDDYSRDGVVLKRDKRGNRKLGRLSNHFKVNTERVVRGLPENWYDPEWWRNLPTWDQKKLETESFRPLPTLSPPPQ